MYRIITFGILAFLILAGNNVFSQENKGGRITGRIVSSMTQSPLPGVTIRVLGTELGAISKKDGSFDITNVPPGIQKVQFNLIGFEIGRAHV